MTTDPTIEAIRKRAQAGTSVQSQCPECSSGIGLWRQEGCAPYRWMHRIDESGAVYCNNFDGENRWIGAAFGLFIFAWLPKRCANGRIRWLCWLEYDGYARTYTLGNRAH